MTAMEELIDRGKIRFIGVSNFSVRELRKAQAALTKHKIVSNQVRYSLIDRTIEGDLLEYCQKAEIAVIAYSPLGKNFSVMRANDPQGTMARVASVCRKTEVQVALNWLIARNKVIAIPKASTVAHAVENCGASDWSLSEAEHSLLEETIRCERCGRVESTLRNWKRHVVQVLGRQI
jgi:diketogulonate reductase-like aldo/keto reductase